MKKNLLKKKFFIAVFLVTLVIVSGTCMVINSIFPVANHPDYPSVKDIKSFSALYDSELIELSDISFGSILMCIKMAEPTRSMSTNERPYVSPYYEIVVNTEAQQYEYYIYNKDNSVFLEIPYRGIYKIDGYVLDLLQ